MKKVAVIILSFVQLFFLSKWLECIRFADKFYFSAFDLKLRLIEAVHNDSGMPLFLVRIFHNKVLGTVIDIYNSYANYLDILFFANLLSFAGAFGLICCLWYFFQGKYGRFVWILFVLALISPLFVIISVVHLPFVLQLGFIATPLLIMSYLGWLQFLKSKNILRYSIFFLLILISLLWIVNVITINQPFCIK